MNTREDAIKYGLSFANTYIEAPFRDQNWQLVRIRGCRFTKIHSLKRQPLLLDVS